MPKPCLGRVDLENYRAGAAILARESLFTVFFLSASEWIQSGLFKILFHDGMFGIVIATTGMNLFKVSLYDFNWSLTTFSGNTRFNDPIRISFEEPSCTKPSYC